MIAIDAETLGRVVRQRRRDLDWTQERLARAAGVSRPWVSEFETGKASVEIGLVFAVLDVLGLRLNVVPTAATQAPLTSSQPEAGPDMGRYDPWCKTHPSLGPQGADIPPDSPRMVAKGARPAITVGGKSIAATRGRRAPPAAMKPSPPRAPGGKAK